MVNFETYTLSNGLRIVAHFDQSTPIAAFNVLYNVGSKDEHPEHTGMAHLFEHLMFEGSANVKEFDVELQFAGGENNAFTNNDITNYYLTLPVKNIETAFYLEADRMSQPAFSEEKLKTQKNVVIEEFKQSYLNQPYGDVMMLLRPLVYKAHPYQWPTIGKKIEHIEKVNMQNVKDFFGSFYKPNNAVISVAGNIKPNEVFKLAEKYFGNISAPLNKNGKLPNEPLQTDRRYLKVQREVPYDEIYIAFKTSERLHDDFYGLDLISDILANGNSSRLYLEMIKNKKMFSDVNASVSASQDPGMLLISGKLVNGVLIDEAEKEILHVIDELKSFVPNDNELFKVKNKVRAANAFADMNVLSKAMNLAYYEYLGNPDLLNQQNDMYFRVSPEDIKALANKYLDEDKASVLHYCRK